MTEQQRSGDPKPSFTAGDHLSTILWAGNEVFTPQSLAPLPGHGDVRDSVVQTVSFHGFQTLPHAVIGRFVRNFLLCNLSTEGKGQLCL